MKVAIVIDVPDEWGDISHESGFTAQGFDQISDELSGLNIVEGPTPLPSTYSVGELGRLG